MLDNAQNPCFQMAPGSSLYSSALIHIFLKVDRPARMEPPIQVEY
jgi:hypothetical protein